MTKQSNRLPLMLAFGAITAGVAIAQPIGQWDFDNANLAATVGGADLTYLDANTQTGATFGTTASFGIPNIGGTDAKVMKFTGWTAPSGLGLPISTDANDGGSLVNSWTLILDVLYPASSDRQFRAIIETDGRAINPDADFFISDTDGIGINGSFHGNVTPAQWHRITFVVDGNANALREYVDGVLAGQQDEGAAPEGGLDGRWALSPRGNAELFNDNNGEVALGYVNSIQLWDTALNSGQILALGTPAAAGIPQTIPPLPAFISSSIPTIGQTGVDPQPGLDVILDAGNSTVTADSVKLLLDGTPVAASVAANGQTYTLDYAVSNTYLDPNSVHQVGVAFNENGTLKTNSFNFTVISYVNAQLPAPIYLETFNPVAEGSLPDGWSVTNNTTKLAGEYPSPIDDLHSDFYLDWVVVDSTRLQGLKGGIFDLGFVVLNGQVLDTLVDGNMLYAESDSRDGSQVQMAFTKDYDLSGKNNIYIGFSSLYEQNQDNINSLEYSIDEGKTWLPLLYLIQEFNDGTAADVIRKPDGTVDAVATLNTIRGDTAYGTSYGAYIGAAITQDLAPYISGRINDDSKESKRVEVIRALKADGQSKVRFRFMQAGTGSWYWGIDNFGIYSIPEPRIVFPPANLTVNYGDNATLKVTASGDATLSYQWLQDGNPIPNATSDTLALTGVTGANTGNYSVKVSNSLGSTVSTAAKLTVVLSPKVNTPPQDVLASAGAPFSLTVGVAGQSPFSYQWQKEGKDIADAKGASYTVAASATTDSGSYTVVITNPSGTATSPAAKVTILPLVPITQDLVVHLPFDADSNDTSGRGNNGTPEIQPEIDGGTLPTYPGGGAQRIGSGAIHISDGQDVALGAPDDLNFAGDVNFTFSFWVKAPATGAWTGDPSFIGNKNWTDGGSAGYVLAAQGGGTFKLNWKAADGSRHDSSAFGIADGAWHNVAMSVDRTGLVYIYVDGSLRTSLSVANEGDISSLDTYIGQDGTGRYGFNNDLTAHFLDINLDDFGIWRRVLTPQEIASIYAHGLAGEDLTKASGQIVVVPAGVTAGPFSQVGNVGGNVTLSASFSGTAPFTYEWRKGGVPIVGQAGPTLTLTSLTSNDAGDYQVVVTNSKGTATSGIATVKVLPGAINQDFVVHIPFDGNYSDTSGHGNNATPKGSPTLEAGKLGQAMRFNTVKDGSIINYATLGSPADLNFGDSTDFSTSMWVNWTDSEDDLPFISNKDWNSSDNPGWGVFSQSGGNFRVNVTGTGGTKMSSSDTPKTSNNGNWHNIVVSFSRGFVVSSYLDGQLVNTTPLLTTGSIDTGKATNLGQDGNGTYTDGGSVRMTGLLDDVGIWRHALTAEDAAAIFAAGQAGHDLSTLTAGTGPADLGKITIVDVAGQVTLNWTGGPGIKLQKASKLSPPADWADVAGTDGASSRNITASSPAGFYRLSK